MRLCSASLIPRKPWSWPQGSSLQTHSCQMPAPNTCPLPHPHPCHSVLLRLSWLELQRMSSLLPPLRAIMCDLIKEGFSQSISNKEHFKGWSRGPCKRELGVKNRGSGRQRGSRNCSRGLRLRENNSESDPDGDGDGGRETEVEGGSTDFRDHSCFSFPLVLSPSPLLQT